MPKKETRKTSNGRAVLRVGEYERTDRPGYVFKWRDKTGRQHSITATTLDRLREREKEVQRDEALGKDIQAGKRTVADYFHLWESQKRGLKPNVRAGYKYTYATYIAPELGRKRVDSIKPSDIAAFYNKKADDGLTIGTLDNIQTVLVQIFDKAEKDDAIRRNPASKALKELKKEMTTKKRKALTPEETERFREVIRGTIWEGPFEFALATGLRVGELTALTWKDIDEKAGQIHIRRTLVDYSEDGKMARIINTPKTDAGTRTLPLGEDARHALEIQKERGNTCTEIIDGIGGFIFATRDGRTHNQQTLNRALRRIRKDANEGAKEGEVLLPIFSMHNLRHTYATQLAASGVDLKTAQELLGHKDIQTTANIYQEATEEMKRRAEEKRRAYTQGEHGEQEGEQGCTD